MLINIKKINPKAIIPTHGSQYSAGYELYACTETMTVIPPHQTVRLRTGLAIELPHGYFGAVVGIKGLASRQGLRVCQGLDIVDEDYRGELVVDLHNDTDMPKTINPMERVALLVVMPYMPLDFNEVDKLSETLRGSAD